MPLLEFFIGLIVSFWEPELFRQQEGDFSCFVVLGLTLLVVVGVSAILYWLS